MLMLILVCLANAADFLPDVPSHVSAPQRYDGGFVPPNEMNPRGLRRLFEQYPTEGAYVAVGTERAFIGFALSAESTHLLMVDKDPLTVLFNRMNIGLLQMAQNRAAYIWLRMEATHEDWLRHLSRARLSPEMAQPLADLERWRWWRDLMVPGRRYEMDREYGSGFAMFHRPAVHPDEPFFGANYLFNQSLFTKVHAAARAGHMRAVQIDLREDAQLETIARALQSAHVSVGILDLSNVWFAPGFSPERVRDVVVKLAPALAARALVVLTGNAPENTPSRFGVWGYYGLSAEYVLADHDGERVRTLLADERQGRGAGQVKCSTLLNLPAAG